MGFYIRKSLSAGPFRFNLSTSGLGVSAGAPGFRIGTGPRGNYVSAGRDGIYYRASLGGGHRTRAQQSHAPASHWASLPHYRPSDVVLHDVSGATALALEPTGSGDVVEQLNKAAKHTGWAWPVTIAAFVLGLIHLPYSVLFTVFLAPLCVWLFLRDQAKRTVVLFYDVHDVPSEWFDSLVTAWAQLASSQKLSRVVQRGQVRTTHQYKVNSGASSLFDSVTAAATTHGPKHLSTNVAVPSLVTRSSRLYFLPDRLLVQEGNRYSDIAYQQLEASSTHARTIEDGGRIPTDAQQVGETWRYVNVDGGPDRRFNNNARLPIMQYGKLDLVSHQGLMWQLQISRAEVAPLIASVVSRGRAMALCSGQRQSTAAVHRGVADAAKAATPPGTADGDVLVQTEAEAMKALKRAKSYLDQFASSDSEFKFGAKTDILIEIPTELDRAATTLREIATVLRLVVDQSGATFEPPKRLVYIKDLADSQTSELMRIVDHLVNAEMHANLAAQRAKARVDQFISGNAELVDIPRELEKAAATLNEIVLVLRLILNQVGLPCEQ